MKRIVAALCLIVGIAFGISASSVAKEPAAVVAVAPVVSPAPIPVPVADTHDNCSRYCNFDVSTVPLVWPSCEGQPGCSIYMDCMFSCWATYQAKLIQINADTCAMCDEFNKTIDRMLADYEYARQHCMSSAQTQAEIDACWQKYDDNVAAAEGLRTLMNNGFATSTTAQENLAKKACEECVENCCDCE